VLIAHGAVSAAPNASPASSLSPSLRPPPSISPPSTPRTLIILESEEQKQTHSAFIQQLKDRGHVVTSVLAGDGVKLSTWGSYHYDHLIFLCPHAEDLGSGVWSGDVQSWVDSGRSVLIVGDVDMAEPLREMSEEILGVDFDPEGYRVIDKEQGVKLAGGDSATAGSTFMARLDETGSAYIGGGQVLGGKFVLYSGIGHTYRPSELIHPVLTASATARSESKREKEFASEGVDTLLVSAGQLKNGARITIAGSLDLFSNRFFTQSFTATASKSGSSSSSKQQTSSNSIFVNQLVQWTFYERGFLRARELTHYKIGAEHDQNPQSYRVSDKIHFSIVLEEYDGGVSRSWRPFHAPDVQLEFTMLDPYYRLNLTESPQGSGRYVRDFQVPDVYGVYKFVIDYHRRGYSWLSLSQSVSIRPFRHDEFERFIWAAYPYYTAGLTTMMAFAVFGIVFLYSTRTNNKQNASGNSKTQTRTDNSKQQ